MSTLQDLKRSPPQSRAAPCDIVNSIITNVIVPRQMMLNVVQLIPKPKGGDRPITITSSVFSLVMDVLGIQMNEWQEAQVAFWDDAVNGSSALRAALNRRMMDELEAGETAHTISGYCDLEKFYDSISIPKLVYHAQAADFPMRPLALILQVHLSTRSLRVNKWLSEPIFHAPALLLAAGPAGTLQE